MITVILHNPIGEPEIEERDESNFEHFVFPTPGHSGGEDGSMSCLSIIRHETDGVISMKIMLRTQPGE